MNPRQQSAVLLEIALQLRANHSWTGETHVQKSAYLLQELLGVPAGFRFILYRHGPFSFDVRDQLHQMEAERAIQLQEQPFPYGPKIVEGTAAQALLRLMPPGEHLRPKIEFIAARLGPSNVSTLERIATALFVLREAATIPANRVARLMELKPHIDRAGAEEAFERLGMIEQQAANEGWIQSEF